MKSGPNYYGLLFTVAALVFLEIVRKIAFWYAERDEAQGAPKLDVTERLERAEARLREAKEELESLRAELTVGR